jgi:hypothetical protein
MAFYTPQQRFGRDNVNATVLYYRWAVFWESVAVQFAWIFFVQAKSFMQGFVRAPISKERDASEPR